eukprot:TRINITY_DN228_c0_g1_i2.p1 TRINITY_DN228_c0_g1~~TRINITY_DN228_c0_g1_i2.p1  ORF type:complete len:389 (-),score=82.99 TRINITY_DN228_c0_g1_i2:51-1217(-)
MKTPLSVLLPSSVLLESSVVDNYDELLKLCQDCFGVDKSCIDLFRLTPISPDFNKGSKDTQVACLVKNSQFNIDYFERTMEQNHQLLNIVERTSEALLVLQQQNQQTHLHLREREKEWELSHDALINLKRELFEARERTLQSERARLETQQTTDSLRLQLSELTNSIISNSNSNSNTNDSSTNSRNFTSQNTPIAEIKQNGHVLSKPPLLNLDGTKTTSPSIPSIAPPPPRAKSPRIYSRTPRLSKSTKTVSLPHPLSYTKTPSPKRSHETPEEITSNFILNNQGIISTKIEPIAKESSSSSSTPRTSIRRPSVSPRITRPTSVSTPRHSSTPRETLTTSSINSSSSNNNSSSNSGDTPRSIISINTPPRPRRAQSQTPPTQRPQLKK